MIDIVLPNNTNALQGLLQIVEAASGGFSTRLPANPHIPGSDEELKTFWRSGLIEQLSDDVSRLRALLRRANENEGRARLAEGEAEGVLRAAAAVRLRLRETVLSEVPDDDLELGLFLKEEMDPQMHPYMATFVLLADLQSAIIQRLDPEADGWMGEEEI